MPLMSYYPYFLYENNIYLDWLFQVFITNFFKKNFDVYLYKLAYGVAPNNWSRYILSKVLSNP